MACYISGEPGVGANSAGCLGKEGHTSQVWGLVRSSTEVREVLARGL